MYIIIKVRMETINLIKMEIQDIMKALAKKGISTSMHYNSEKDQCYVDLETRAKSELHLYEDGVLRGRYQYEKQIDLNQDATIYKQQQRIEVLQGDSVIIHTFFEEQSQKYDDFYNDYVNFKK